MADPKSNAQFCERCGQGQGVGRSPYPEDDHTWVRICRPCLDVYDAAVEADRAMLAEADRLAAWEAQAEVLVDG